MPVKRTNEDGKQGNWSCLETNEEAKDQQHRVIDRESAYHFRKGVSQETDPKKSRYGEPPSEDAKYRGTHSQPHKVYTPNATSLESGESKLRDNGPVRC